MDHTIEKTQLIQDLQTTRNLTIQLCCPLTLEDYVIQTTPDVSPPKWHLAHTTWFFETFILNEHMKNYQIFHPLFHYLFNSYYHGVGKFYPRSQRGFLARPTVETIFSYRQHTDEALIHLIKSSDDDLFQKLKPLIILGINHEQQHQELLFMDIKYNLFHDPSFPIYQARHDSFSNKPKELELLPNEGGIIEIGNHAHNFCFDNESPRHALILKPYRLANRLVTNEEYIEFINAKGYQNPNLWLADGWDAVIKNRWQAPLYWKKIEDTWHQFTLSGMQKVNKHEPVSHISYFEADAYARWRGLRLPLESEWEHFVTQHNINSVTGNFLENKIYHPSSATNTNIPQQFLGDLWEWTASPYSPYPGFKQWSGVLGEYNGKFMSNQMVLRGGSCITPRSHIRNTYRNFFQLDKRWQFSGIRLACDG